MHGTNGVLNCILRSFLPRRLKNTSYPVGPGDGLEGKTMNKMGMFVVQRWHRPYGKALLEEASARRGALISEAQDAIFTRYLELCVSVAPTDEDLDLLRAIDALSQLRDTDKLVRTLEIKLDDCREGSVGKIGMNGNSK